MAGSLRIPTVATIISLKRRLRPRAVSWPSRVFRFDLMGELNQGNRSELLQPPGAIYERAKCLITKSTWITLCVKRQFTSGISPLKATRVQGKILLAVEFTADFEKKYMRVSSRVRTSPPLTPTLSPMRREGETGGRFGA
jgi:hypothetical protein